MQREGTVCIKKINKWSNLCEV